MITKSNIQRKLIHTYHRMTYAQSVRNVLQTPPVAVGTMPFLVLSMVHTRDVLSYLVALKSFARFANPRRIVIVCDQSITKADREVFRSHIPHVELRDAASFAHTSLPRGGCWERLYAITEYSPKEYVVQLDADTVTISSPTAVISAIQRENGFVLGEETEQNLLGTAATSLKWRQPIPANAHIQTIVEASMHTAPLPKDALYVRGCAGFTGFPRSMNLRTQLLEFSEVMFKIHAERWKKWGTEQIASNYLVANSRETKVLPFPSYGTPDVLNATSIFMHFLGSLRFTSNKYRVVTEKVIEELRLPLPAAA